MQAAPGWVKVKTAGIGYCGSGGHFTTANDTVWKFFVTPLVSRESICDECAKKVLRDAS